MIEPMTIETKQDRSRIIGETLIKAGYDFAVTLPCGMLKTLIQFMEDTPRILHVPLTREEEGVGICAGAYLGGKKPVMIIQSSGIANSFNSITSLTIAYQMPLLIILSYRGSLFEFAPAQVPLGVGLEGILRSLGIPYFILEDSEKAEKIVHGADRLAQAGSRPVVILLTRQP